MIVWVLSLRYTGGEEGFRVRRKEDGTPLKAAFEINQKTPEELGNQGRSSLVKYKKESVKYVLVQERCALIYILLVLESFPSSNSSNALLLRLEIRT